VDGCLYPDGHGLQEKKITPSWVHLGCFGGYYLPAGGDAVIHVTEGERRFFELWLSHGEKPQGACYAYVMLPGRSAEETAGYSADPDVEILACTKQLHAVKEKRLGITAIVFWEAGSYGGITVDKPCIVMAREADGRLRLAVSEPTQKAQTVQMKIERALTAEQLDERITVGTVPGDSTDESAVDEASANRSFVELVLDFTETQGETLVGVFLDS